MRIAISANGSKLFRYFNLKYHYVKEVLTDDIKEIRYCKNKDMVADIFTKVLWKKIY
jgi:hypothetical protein